LKVYGKPLVYLDNAAFPRRRPNAVLERMTEAYKNRITPTCNRGLHYLANAATEAYEGGPRQKVAKVFSTPQRAEEIVFHPATRRKAINLVAYSWGRAETIKAGRRDRDLDHGSNHSNIVPWHFSQGNVMGAVIKWGAGG